MSKLNQYKITILQTYRSGGSMYHLAAYYGVSPWGIYKQVNRWATLADREMRREKVLEKLRAQNWNYN